MTPLQQIQGLLPKLSDTELATARLLIADYKSSKHRVPSAKTADWLLPGIERELRRRGLLVRAITPERVGSLVASYNANSFVVRDWLVKATAVTKYTDQLALGIIAARSLAGYLEPIAPIGLKLLLNNVTKVPEAIEASFPGYAACGLLGALIHA